MVNWHFDQQHVLVVLVCLSCTNTLSTPKAWCRNTHTCSHNPNHSSIMTTSKDDHEPNSHNILPSALAGRCDHYTHLLNPDANAFGLSLNALTKPTALPPPPPPPGAVSPVPCRYSRTAKPSPLLSVTRWAFRMMRPAAANTLFKT